MRKTSLALAAALAASMAVAGCAGSMFDRSATSRMGAGPAAPVPLSQSLPETRIDADMQAVLSAHASLQPKPIETLSPQDARLQPTPADAVNVVLRQQGKSIDPEVLVPGVKHVDRMITGAAGPIPARIYTPAGNGPFPVIVYFHGGGWVIADKQVYDGGARGLAKQANAVVVSVDYRLAPEAKFPAAWDDALAAYRWTLANAASIKGDPKSVALAGESAGGNLAITTAIAARDARLQQPFHVLAVYPVAQNSLTTESYERHADARPLNRPMVKWFVGHLTRSPADLQDPRLHVVGARLQGLPPVTLINASIDPLLDDSAMLETALRRAGVPVERRVYYGVAHEFFGMAAVVGKARQAQEWAGQRLKASLL